MPKTPRRVQNPPPERPLLVWDGDCGFCLRWVRRWRKWVGERADDAPYQEVAECFPEIPVEDFQEAVHLILPDGRVFSGAEAVFRSVEDLQGACLLAESYEKWSWFRSLSEAGYRFVARNRPFFSKWTP